MFNFNLVPGHTTASDGLLIAPGALGISARLVCGHTNTADGFLVADGYFESAQAASESTSLNASGQIEAASTTSNSATVGRIVSGTITADCLTSSAPTVGRIAIGDIQSQSSVSGDATTGGTTYLDATGSIQAVATISGNATSSGSEAGTGGGGGGMWLGSGHYIAPKPRKHLKAKGFTSLTFKISGRCSVGRSFIGESKARILAKGYAETYDHNRDIMIALAIMLDE
jgi:hypothetical protein